MRRQRSKRIKEDADEVFVDLKACADEPRLRTAPTDLRAHAKV